MRVALLIWTQLKEFFFSGGIYVVQLFFLYLVVRFTVAVASTLVEVAKQTAPRRADAPAGTATPQGEAAPPQIPAQAAPQQLPESTSTG